VNLVFLIGNLVADPELRYTSSSTPVVNFTLAVNRHYKNENGEREADFIQVVAWSKLAENCHNYLKKGNQAAVVGRLRVRSYDDSQGIRRKATEVVASEVKFLSFNNDRNGNGVDAGDSAEVADELNEEEICF
jgi:single-strand DNA-binding protein